MCLVPWTTCVVSLSCRNQGGVGLEWSSGLAIREVAVQIPTKAAIWFEAFEPLSNRHSYNEYTVVGKIRRRGRGLATVHRSCPRNYYEGK